MLTIAGPSGKVVVNHDRTLRFAPELPPRTAGGLGGQAESSDGGSPPLEGDLRVAGQIISVGSQGFLVRLSRR